MPSPIANINGAPDEYWHVDLGPIPNKPDWHVQSDGTSYPFPTEKAARTFAANAQRKDPDREVRVRKPGEVGA